jgi:hypothetical protein
MAKRRVGNKIAGKYLALTKLDSLTKDNNLFRLAGVAE